MTTPSKLIANLAALAVASSLSPGLSAHHSFSMFDMQKTVTIAGTVNNYQWTNPHVWIDLTVTDPVTHQESAYSVEGGSTAILVGMGWSRATLSKGDKVALVVHPLRSGTGGSLVSGSVNGKPVGPEQAP